MPEHREGGRLLPADVSSQGEGSAVGSTGSHVAIGHDGKKKKEKSCMCGIARGDGLSTPGRRLALGDKGLSGVLATPANCHVCWRLNAGVRVPAQLSLQGEAGGGEGDDSRGIHVKRTPGTPADPSACELQCSAGCTPYSTPTHPCSGPGVSL